MISIAKQEYYALPMSIGYQLLLFDRSDSIFMARGSFKWLIHFVL